MIYIGIDPGAGGGIAFIVDPPVLAALDVEVLALPMPATEQDILRMIREGFVTGAVEGLKPRPAFAVLERVWSMPGQGHSGAFKFGVSVGMLRMALSSVGIPFDEVLPRTWQKAMGVVYPKGATDTQKKNITKRRAQQLFPGLINVTHAIADALLLAEFCRRTRQGHGSSHQIARGVSNGKAQGRTRGETREEFERDRFGETGESLAQRSRAAFGSSNYAAASRQGEDASAAGHGGHARPRAGEARVRRR
jgi:hypothetical protein